jgi:excisionase family DNA binding protein
MSAFTDAAREVEQLTQRVATLEAKVKDLLARKEGPERTGYKPSEVAKMIGWSADAVRMWIRDGKLPAEDMGGGRYIVPAWAAEALVPRREGRRSA